MENNFFINFISDFFIDRGFIKKGSKFIKSYSDLTIMVSLEKDRHAVGYRFAVCYYINRFLGSSSNVLNVPQHMVSRFLSFDDSQIDKEFFDIEKLEKGKLIEAINSNFEIFINNIECLSDLISKIKFIPDLYILSQDVENYIKLMGVDLPVNTMSRSKPLIQRFLEWLGF